MKRLFIFDTSVVLQAMLSRKSVAFVAIKKADNAGIIVVSDATLLELEEKMYLPKFDKYQSLNNRLAFFKAYSLLALNIEPTIKITACRDPKDDKFLELAKTASADCIITHDKDLLVLNPFEGIPIFTPPDFLTRYFSFQSV
jgi:uncharacterized protein